MPNNNAWYSPIACYLLCLLLCSFSAAARDSTACHHMVRIYEDNDLIKVFGDVSDKGYTNGTRLDYYYTKDHASRFFLDRWLPKAGREAVNTFSLSLAQTMYTPEKLNTTLPDVKDWPYSGALYISHSLHSSSPVKKYNLQTELIAGVMGKASLTEQMQLFIHTLIDAAKPMGWDKQYPSDVLLNINFTAEKQLWQLDHMLDVLAGGQAMAGTMLDGANIYTQLRVGWMLPYFDGLLSQYSKPFSQKKKLRAYLVARPSLNWIGYNAVLEGGVFNGKSDYYKDNPADARMNHSISRQLDLGAVLGYGSVSVAFTQRIMPRLVHGLPHERVGNLSLYVAW